MRFLVDVMLKVVVIIGCSVIALSQEAQPRPCPQLNQQREPNLTTWYEPQLDRTTVNLRLARPFGTNDDYEMHIRFWHNGHALKAPTTVSLLFMQIPPCSGDRRTCFDLTVVLDSDERLPLGGLIGTGLHVTLSGVDMYVTVPLKTFLRIARAKKIQTIIGGKKFELSEKYIEAIRQLGDRIEGEG